MSEHGGTAAIKSIISVLLCEYVSTTPSRDTDLNPPASYFPPLAKEYKEREKNAGGGEDKIVDRIKIASFSQDKIGRVKKHTEKPGEDAERMRERANER